VQAFDEHNAAQIMVESVPQDQVQLYGVTVCKGVKPDAGDSTPICAMVEKPKAEDAPSDLAVVGRYVLPARVMALLANTKPGAGGEIQLTDALYELLKEHKVEAYRMTGNTFDCGNNLFFLQANVAYGLQHPETAEAFKQFLTEQG
jgi:UTP--glucose-1-phosphate uridylyltransferase